MWYIKVNNKKAVQYTEKYRGYTSRKDFATLAKYQKSIIEYYNNTTIKKCIVKNANGYAWRYLKGNTFVYHHIKGTPSTYLLSKFLLKNIINNSFSYIVK